MFTTADILSLFFQEKKSVAIKETIDSFSLEVEGFVPKTVDPDSLINLIVTTSNNDSVKIIIENGEDDVVSCNSDNLKASEFWAAWKALPPDTSKEDENIKFTFRVTKKPHDLGIINIYDLNTFSKYLELLSLNDFLALFNELFKKGDVIHLVSPELNYTLESNTIKFIKSIPKEEVKVEAVVRNKVWDKLKSVSHFTGLNQCVSLPSDFLLIDNPSRSCPTALRDKFAKVSILLCLATLFDFSVIDEKKITLRLNGYRSFSTEIELDKVNTRSLDQYYKIYQWVVSDGGIFDKIGLARNLISLNIDPSDSYSLVSETFIPIISGYKAYEKQNVKQYIELRNKMSDQIISFNEKASKIVDSFASSFQKSALVLISLFSTIIVSKVLTSREPKNVFSFEAGVLSFTFLGFSFIYFLVSWWEIKEQEKRFIEAYRNMKVRNEDLLTKEDIERILNKDKEHKEDVRFIKEKKKYYSLMWLSFIFILFIVVVGLSSFDWIGLFLKGLHWVGLWMYQAYYFI
ncbi:hypothetical protein [Chitinophaga arvensicola]|uniref:Uncharacterized protein n=1 Tax=Chitinophaga arvensicola TaxID=29529 RepID=A0A1I0QJG6_9BACT|nr:hypothetical protein [Chitinophaga arvensicola]SEW27368.1 hypothetical protein SAMN04488122_1521 [Chitinophaga arvensicola]